MILAAEMAACVYSPAAKLAVKREQFTRLHSVFTIPGSSSLPLPYLPLIVGTNMGSMSGMCFSSP